LSTPITSGAGIDERIATSKYQHILTAGGFAHVAWLQRGKIEIRRLAGATENQKRKRKERS
jgi:hypothetical protein